MPVVDTMDGEGYVKIVDRAKDLVKSGGEWISSVDLENTLMGHPAVKEACVVGIPRGSATRHRENMIYSLIRMCTTLRQFVHSP